MEELYAKYNRLMFAIAWRYTKDPHEVADIVSNSCLKLMKNLATLKTLGAHESVNGETALVMEDETGTSIVWSEGKKYFILQLDESKEEALNVARGVCMIEVQ